MSKLHIPYSDLENMPLDYIEWFYRKIINEEVQNQG